ncbi:CopG family transcriptional regulator [Candidatus Poribacteria bacterium]
MKTITLPDEIVRNLQQISIRSGVLPEEIIKRGISEYLLEIESEPNRQFEAIGFGMWTECSGDCPG